MSTRDICATEVYPRVCGGTLAGQLPLLLVQGLSPRVRGNPSANQRGVPAVRSIPACAGEPGGGVDTGAAGKVYPRVCGGTTIRNMNEGEEGGLSPRVRGNP